MFTEKLTSSRKVWDKKVLIAMSGGVDSSFTALLLKKQGFNVTGIHLNFFGQKNKNIQEVKKLAKIIDIPLKVIDVHQKFKKEVINYFLSELKKGNTPNPCIVCNKEIKFKILFDEMLLLKADYVATGHYARLRREFPITNFQFPSKSKSERFILMEAEDKSKDQSYFLYKLSQTQLPKILFPLGEYKKSEVRKLAKKMDLPVHDKAESQDICFITPKGYDDFLRKNISLKQGKICDFEGKILGTHKGLPLYTIGQRKGIELGGKGPYCVTGKDFKRNMLIVGQEIDLFSKKMKLKDINWMTKKPRFPFKTLIRTRYRSPLVHAIINKNEVVFEKPQRAITPGQSAVFYSRKGEVLGGGTII